MRKTTIVVSEKNWKLLGQMRIDLGLKTYNDVITLLIRNMTKKWKKLKKSVNITKRLI